MSSGTFHLSRLSRGASPGLPAGLRDVPDRCPARLVPVFPAGGLPLQAEGARRGELDSTPYTTDHFFGKRSKDRALSNNRAN